MSKIKAVIKNGKIELTQPLGENIPDGEIEIKIKSNHKEASSDKGDILKAEIIEKSKEYYRIVHKPQQEKEFKPGKSKLSYAGRVYDELEIENLIDSSLEFWLTTGRYAKKFESELANFLGVKDCFLVNSGSSANLLAFMTLTSPRLKERQVMRGDEVITVAAGFPTTVAPIIQYGAVPVFVDVTLPGYNIDISKLKDALSPKTKAVMLAHTLGNPFNIKAVKEFCEEHNLWMIEDNCDALGSKYLYNEEWKYTGTIGDIGTSSFYPPHHMTMGEGGAVYTNNSTLKDIILSLRDWGRDCWCPSGKDNTCGKRFDWELGELPQGYDHKYIYSHFGYNLKVTDMQAAVGCAQLKKLPAFIKSRKNNWQMFKKELSSLEDFFILPEAEENSEPSWFGFLLTVKEEAPFNREDIVKFLEEKKIQTRMLFSGNLLKHPCFDQLKQANEGYRIVGELTTTDRIMNHTFWIGVYPGLTNEMNEFIIQSFHQFIGQYKK